MDEELREKLFTLLSPHLPPEMGIGERYALIRELVDAVCEFAGRDFGRNMAEWK